jgi:nucleoside-diphosphate-sugar epimerase
LPGRAAERSDRTPGRDGNKPPKGVEQLTAPEPQRRLYAEDVRIFLAGASGVIGVRLVPLLVADGHAVAGMTRSPDKVCALAALGAEPVVCDVLDADALGAAVAAFRPDAVIHQLTDLPDDAGEIAAFAERNDRVRTEGTANLLAAAAAAGSRRFLAQSIAWTPARAETLREFERLVLDAGGVVVRYGRFYGPGTYYESEVPPPPRVHVDRAAQATVPLLSSGEGLVVIAQDEVDARSP